MSKILNYILGAIALILLFFVLFTQCSNSKKTTEIAKLKNELFACQNAPIKSDTVIIYDTITEYRYIKPTPRPRPSGDNNPGVSSTTSTGCSNISPVYYSEVFKKKGAQVHWEAYTICENDSAKIQEIRFPEIILPKEIITNTKTVHDTIPKEVPAKIKSKFAIYGGAVANNLKNFPGVELGVGYLHKQTWMLSGGALYLDNKAYGNLRVTIMF